MFVKFWRQARQFAPVQSLIFLVVLFVIFSFLSPYFPTFSNLQNIITASPVIVLISLGATFVTATGGIVILVFPVRFSFLFWAALPLMCCSKKPVSAFIL